MLLRRTITFTSTAKSHIFQAVCNCSSKTSTILDKKKEEIPSDLQDNGRSNSVSYFHGFHLSPLFTCDRPRSNDFHIEVVDLDTWQVSSGLAQAWQESGSLFTKLSDQPVNTSQSTKTDPDFDEIETMRIRGDLFYKLDRDSKEFEEYNVNFRRKKMTKNKDDQKGSQKRENPDNKLASRVETFKNLVNDKYSASTSKVKKLRTPTFNQLTGPYHEPFCLDIYVSKSSVRACIVHRATSKVVAVAHSISKDMKFDLSSTKDSTACAVVGGVLAQRALADDIYDVVYTPRKGEKLEGKLQIVVQSVIDSGINVKIKLKKQRPKKAGYSFTA